MGFWVVVGADACIVHACTPAHTHAHTGTYQDREGQAYCLLCGGILGQTKNPNQYANCSACQNCTEQCDCPHCHLAAKETKLVWGEGKASGGGGDKDSKCNQRDLERGLCTLWEKYKHKVKAQNSTENGERSKCESQAKVCIPVLSGFYPQNKAEFIKIFEVEQFVKIDENGAACGLPCEKERGCKCDERDPHARGIKRDICR